MAEHDFEEAPSGNEAPLSESPITRVAGENLEYGRRVRPDVNGRAVYSDAGENFFGVTVSRADQYEAVGIYLRNHSAIIPIAVDGAVDVDDLLYPADDGKFTTTINGRAQAQAMQASAGAGIISAVLLGFYWPAVLDIAEGETVVYHDDFISGFVEDGGKFSESADKADWLLTLVDGGGDNAEVCKVADDGPGGILVVTTNDASGDLNSLQLNGEAFQLAAGKELLFRARLAIKDISETDLFVGLAITDIGILAGVTDRIGFQVDHDGNIDCLIEQDSTEYNQDSGKDIADCAAIANFAAQSVELAFHWDGVDTVRFSVNGEVVKTFTDNGTTIVIPDDEALTPTLEVKAASAAAQTVWVDEIHAEMQR